MLHFSTIVFRLMLTFTAWVPGEGIDEESPLS